MPVTFKLVQDYALTLPGVTAERWWGTPGLKVEGKGFARLKEDGVSLMIRMSLLERDFVLQAEPDVYFITDHYRDYPAVLVRLAKLTRPRMKEIVEEAVRLVRPPARAARKGKTVPKK